LFDWVCDVFVCSVIVVAPGEDGFFKCTKTFGCLMWFKFGGVDVRTKFFALDAILFFLFVMDFQ